MRIQLPGSGVGSPVRLTRSVGNLLMGSIGLPELLIILFLLGIGLAILIGVFFVVKAASKSGKRQCPYCAEWIQMQTTVCRFCGRDIVSK